MDRFVKSLSDNEYQISWTDKDGFHKETVYTLQDAYARYLSRAKYVDGSGFMCVKVTQINFE